MDLNLSITILRQEKIKYYTLLNNSDLFDNFPNKSLLR